MISAGRPARSLRDCCARDRNHDDTPSGRGLRQVDADLARTRPADDRCSGASFGASTVPLYLGRVEDIDERARMGRPEFTTPRKWWGNRASDSRRRWVRTAAGLPRLGVRYRPALARRRGARATGGPSLDILAVVTHDQLEDRDHGAGEHDRPTRGLAYAVAVGAGSSSPRVARAPVGEWWLLRGDRWRARLFDQGGG